MRVQARSAFVVRWIGAGLLLDTALIAGTWGGIGLMTPISLLGGVCLGVPMLIAVGHVVHILMLPAVRRDATVSMVVIWGDALVTVAMGSVAAFLAGAMAFLALGMTVSVLSPLRGSRVSVLADPGILDHVAALLIFAVPAGIGGLVTGFIENVFRPDMIRPVINRDTWLPFPSVHLRSDLLGGAIAGFVWLAFPVSVQWIAGGDDAAARFRLSLAIVAGLAALLPHLLLLASDNLRADRASAAAGAE